MEFLERKGLVQEKKIVRVASTLFITIQKQDRYFLKNKRIYPKHYPIYQMETMVDGYGERILQNQDYTDYMLASLEQFM